MKKKREPFHKGRTLVVQFSLNGEGELSIDRDRKRMPTTGRTARIEMATVSGRGKVLHKQRGKGGPRDSEGRIVIFTAGNNGRQMGGH